MVRFVVSASLLVASLTSLAAAAPAPEAIAEGKRHFEAGDKAFKLGEFEKAIAEYRAAYDAVPYPVLLFDLGQAYRRASHLELALHSYQQYLIAAPPDAPAREEAEKLVAELEVRIAQLHATQGRPPDGIVESGELRRVAAEPTPRRVWYREPAGWSFLSTGLLLGGVGAGLAGHGYSLADQARDPGNLATRDVLLADSASFRTAGWVLIGVGGAAALTGVLLFIVRRHSALPKKNGMVAGSSTGMLYGGQL